MNWIVLAGVIFLTEAYASEQVGTLTQIEGTVKLFTHPSKKLDALAQDSPTAPRALFEGEYYRVRNAQVGDAVEKGNIVRTSPGSKARVVFENGDQYNVGPGTAYRVFWNQDTATAEAKIDLMYGKLRGVVTKGGPRSRLLIRTKSATMGVRGTDFFIASGVSQENGIRTEETEVSIIRGAVEVTPLSFGKATSAAPIEVKAGYSAEVTLLSEKADPKVTAALQSLAKAELRKTTQEALTGIQKSSEFRAKIPSAASPSSPLAEGKAKAIQVLEEKAVNATLIDMKHADPVLFAQMTAKNFKSADEVNRLAIEKLKPDAPKAPPARKPFKSEMEDLDRGAYDRYFKPAQPGRDEENSN